MTKRRVKKLVSVMLCLFTVSFIICTSFISVSAATYFTVGSVVTFDETTNRYGELAASFYGNDSGLQFVYKDEAWEGNYATYEFSTWGFGLSWHPQFSRNYIQAGTRVQCTYILTPDFAAWASQIKYTYGLDPADYITVRCSSSSLAEASKWDNGTYYNQATIVRPLFNQVAYPGENASDLTATGGVISFMCPIETVSFIFEFTAPGFEIVLEDPVPSFGNLVYSFEFKILSIDPSYAAIGKEKGDLTNNIGSYDNTQSEMTFVEETVAGMIDQDAAVGALNPDELALSSVIDADKQSHLQSMIVGIWDALGAELNFVLTFSLIVGLAIFLLGKKAKS